MPHDVGPSEVEVVYITKPERDALREYRDRSLPILTKLADLLRNGGTIPLDTGKLIDLGFEAFKLQIWAEQHGLKKGPG